MSKHRVKSTLPKKKVSQKSFVYSSYPDTNSYSYPDVDYDIQRGKWASVLAYKTDSAVNRASGLIADAVDQMRWRIMSDADGKDKEIASSDDRKPRHPFAQAINDVFTAQGQPLLSMVALSTQLFGATYIAKTTNEYNMRRGIRVLNPNWTDPQVINGEIVWFQYGGVNGTRYIQIPPEYVAYYHTYNPDDDLRGYSKVDAALDSINRNRYARQFVKFTYQNNARPGGVVAPPTTAAGDVTLSPNEVDDVTRILRDNHQGTRNANNMLILPRPLNVTLLDQPEIDKYYSIVPITEKEVFRTFGVPLAMAGDSSASTYKDGDEVFKAFYKNTIIPLCRVIAKYFNATLMPWLDPYGNCTFEFDTSAYEDTTKSEKALADLWATRLQGSYVYLNEARLAQGLEARPEFEGRILVSGIPTRVDQLDVVVSPSPQSFVSQFPQINGATPKASRLPARATGFDDETHDHKVYEFPISLTVDEWREKALKELEACQTRAKKGRKFTLEYTKHLATGVDLDTITQENYVTTFDRLFAAVRFVPFAATLAKVDRLFSSDTTKAFSDTRDAFEIEMLDAIIQGFDDEIKRSRFVGLIHRLIDRLGPQAYRDGLSDSGIDDPELDAEDDAELKSLIQENRAYVGDFAKELYAGNYSQDQLFQRPRMWANKTLTAFYYAGLGAGNKNALFEWVRGPTSDGCKDCVRLNGQRHRMKEWIKSGWLPKSLGKKTTECKGFECLCDFVPARGQSYGGF